MSAYLLKALCDRLHIGTCLKAALKDREFTAPVEQALFAMVANLIVFPAYAGMNQSGWQNHRGSSRYYPYLEREDILEAISYAALRAMEIEVSLAS